MIMNYNFNIISGKTSSSSAIAVACSDAGLRTLIVSTDPAHSLGDALAVDLSSGNIEPIVTEENLSALEIDVHKAMTQFEQIARGLDTSSLADSLGVPKEIIDGLGLDDLTSIFKNPPPGIDEIVALINIFKLSKETLPNGSPRFNRIIIDTAPTGHTLRLLQLPVFLGSITTKLIKFRAKLSSAVDSFKALFGGASDGNSKSSKFFDTLSQLETFQEDLASLKSVLEDPKQTQFVVVTIPTSLAVAESERLVDSLKKQQIQVSSIICNQIVSSDYGAKYLERRRSAQRRCVDIIQREAIAGNFDIVEAPFVDTEVTGVYGLRYFATVAHPIQKPITSTNPINSKKLTIFGGKGGVGKICFVCYLFN
jgi:arsenite/tail-anchored protein-transporting ATPase